jgi:DNA-binding transcriptional regulator/RsmH inhibitor MraZ
VADTLGPTPKVEPPRGMYPAKLDEKGRMKFPAVFQAYLEGLPEKTLYVTSLDRRIAQIYPMPVWRQVESFIGDFTADPEVAENVMFTASELGSEAEMDSQGRIVFSPELRRELGIENKPVHLYAYNGHIDVLSEEIFLERKQQASQKPREDLKKLQGAGLK